MYHDIRKLLVVGVPGTGKTTVGVHLQNKHGFRHLDFEDAIRRDSFPDAFRAALQASSDTVASWGFIPDEQQTGLVLQLRSRGFHLLWLDGDRLAARRAFLSRGDVPITAFEVQMQRINASGIIKRLEPFVVNPFDANGKFRPTEEVIQEMLASIG